MGSWRRLHGAWARSEIISPPLPGVLAQDTGRMRDAVGWRPSLAVLLTLATYNSMVGPVGAARLIAPAPEASLPQGPYLPVVLWHGMGDSCCNPQGIGAVANRIRAALPGVFVHSVATGDDQASDVLSTYLGNAGAQVDAACATLRTLPELASGYVGVGFSQGGLLLRAAVQRCAAGGGPQAHTLVTMGSPHQGVMDVPGCWQAAMAAGEDGERSWSWCQAMQALLGHGAYYPWLQRHVIQAQYFKDPFHLDWYLETSGFLADINNDRPATNASYAAALTSLHRLVLIQFENDMTVVPAESAQFGFFNGTHMVALRDSDAYADDRLGLRTLNESGRLTMSLCPGFHMQFTLDWFHDHVVLPYLAVPAGQDSVDVASL